MLKTLNLSASLLSLRVTLLTGAGAILAACGTPATLSEAVNEDTTNWCFSGGPIYTANDSAPLAQALAVKDGKISYVGTDAVSPGWCADYAGEEARRVDLDGAALYPGLTDAHAHLLAIGLREIQLNLEGTGSISALKTSVASALSDVPEGETLYGRGWIETHWPENRFPNRYDLDAVAPNNPVILERADGHAVVVNSLALKRAGITQATPSPFGGDIRKMDDGEPSGMLVDNAAKLVEALLPKLTNERRTEAYVKGAALYARRGWTNVHSMSVDPDDINLINTLANSGDIKIKVYNSIDLLDGRDMPKVETKAENALITTRAIKLYADGALGSRGAALLAPYSDDPDNVGLMLLKEDTAMPILTAALRNGTQVNTHAIGDKANRQILAWYEKALDAVPPGERSVKAPRWRVEHAQIINWDDLQQFAALGVIPSMQPSHAIGDLHFAVDRLGVERLKGGYAWQSLIDSGIVIAGGSDAPVEVGDPRIEFYAATVRKDLSGYSNEAWYDNEKVSPQDALKMFTIWPAYAAFEEDDTGSLEVGKMADLTVMATDIMTADPEDILTAEPLMTIVNGLVAFER